LRPGADVLILDPRGGLDILTAYSQGAQRVIAVEANALIVEAAEHIYSLPGVQVEIESGRSFIHNSRDEFDVIVYSLSNAYHPVRSGAYSLAEDYRFTRESFQDALASLKPDGLLVVTRWLQLPPSEWLRSFALAVTALENIELDPASRIVALRSFNVGLLLIKQSSFTSLEMETIREFASTRAFDMVIAPDIQSEEVNRYNILEAPLYYQAFTELLAAQAREEWYASYPYEVSPPVDDQPFFGHFFKWEQTGQVLAELSNTWQPFGGAGYIVLLVFLGLAILMASVLILLPITVARLFSTSSPAPHLAANGLALPALSYFGLLGLAFLLVEIPLIQRFILFLGHPAYAMTAVLFALLLFSGVGSRMSHRLSLRPALAALVGVVIIIPLSQQLIFDLALGLSLGLRVVVTVVLLAPLGFLMGVPFPKGIQALETASPGLIPWVWGVNGAISVVSSVLAALLALSYGFRLVMLIGAVCYAGAWLVAGAFTAAQSPSPRL
jgi:SAM-dependent methyltransferase